MTMNKKSLTVKQVESFWEEAWDYLYKKIEKERKLVEMKEAHKEGVRLFSGYVIYTCSQKSSTVIYMEFIGEEEWLKDATVFRQELQTRLYANVNNHDRGTGVFRAYFAGEVIFSEEGTDLDFIIKLTQWLVHKQTQKLE